MPKLKDLQARMKSIQDTQKLTNAMYMIASNRRRKSLSYLEHALPFFEAIRGEINQALTKVHRLDSHYLFPEKTAEGKQETWGILVISADRGLAGAYNLNVFKETDRLLAQCPGSAKLYLLGRQAQDHYHKKPIETVDLPHLDQLPPSFDAARELSAQLLAAYDQGSLQKVFVVYTDLVNPLQEAAKSTRLLPFHREKLPEDLDKAAGASQSRDTDFAYYPDAESVVQSLIRCYFTGFVYGALLDSLSSEENSRLNAMHQANDNARELLDLLRVQRNLARQETITSAISEVSAGAKAQEHDRAKRR